MLLMAKSLDCFEVSMLSVKEFVNNWKNAMRDSVKGASLAIIQVGNVEASNRYVKNKLKDCAEVGIEGTLYKYDDISEDDLCNVIQSIQTDGIIVQLPLPKHIDTKRITECIPKEKDVDGFRADSEYTPCTPGGIIKYLESNDFKFEGANAVVLGRSEIVGRPMAKLLLDRSCTVTVLHSRSSKEMRDIALANADLVVCAVGKRGVMRSSEAPRAFIVDVGINFNDDGKLCGDVVTDYGDESRVTPVPGGVGLLTRAMLMNNTIEANAKHTD